MSGCRHCTSWQLLCAVSRMILFGPVPQAVFNPRVLTVCRQAENDHGEHALHGAESEHQRETHFEDCEVVGLRIRWVLILLVEFEVCGSSN